MDDIPKGQFICTYAGHLITEEESDIRAHKTGDEYFAELDFVVCLKKLNRAHSNHHDSSDSDDSNSNKYLKSNKNKNNSNEKSTPRKNPIAIASKEEANVIFLDSDEDEQGN